MGFADPARALACAAATGDWVLVLDADELVPEPLSRRLREIAERGQVDAVRLPRQNHLLGAPLRHTGWDPERDRPLRFFRRGRATAPRGIHRHYEPVPGARVLDLRAEPGAMLVHFNYVDVSQFLEKLDRYTSIEADEAPAGEAPGALRVLGGALRELIARYVVHRGFADGWRGLYLSLFMSGYRLVVGAKRTERARVGDRAAVERRYRDEALRILAGYGGR